MRGAEPGVTVSGMDSPFPGMDPFIEQPDLWLDFHNNLAVEVQGRLNAVIQPKYFAGLGSYVTYDVLDIQLALPLGRRAVRPDVDVWRTSTPDVGPDAPTAAVPLEVPVELLSVEVRATAGRELVTVIEILSPINKRTGHPANADYLRKRSEILRTPAHLLEIDPLRCGQRPPLLPEAPLAPYYAMLSRVAMRPEVEVWPIHLFDPLPVLPVPLRAPDPDVPLDLGAAVQTVYRRGGYASRIDYALPPPLPHDPAQMASIDDRLRALGLR